MELLNLRKFLICTALILISLVRFNDSPSRPSSSCSGKTTAVSSGNNSCNSSIVVDNVDRWSGPGILFLCRKETVKVNFRFRRLYHPKCPPTWFSMVQILLIQRGRITYWCYRKARTRDSRNVVCTTKSVIFWIFARRNSKIRIPGWIKL